MLGYEVLFLAVRMLPRYFWMFFFRLVLFGKSKYGLAMTKDKLSQHMARNTWFMKKRNKSFSLFFCVLPVLTTHTPLLRLLASSYQQSFIRMENAWAGPPNAKGGKAGK